MMKKKRILGIIILLLIIITFTGSFIYYQKNHKSINEIPVEEKETLVIEEETEHIDIELSKDVDLQKEREKYKNNDIVARLEIPDLFNILIVHGTDNTFYLDHDLYRKKDIKGTEYLDYRVNTEAKQINIYGHNSRTFDIPFRKLEKFLDQEYFDSHEYIVLQTFNTKRIYRIFSIKEDNGDYEHMKVKKTDDEFIEHIEILMKDSIHTREVKYDKDSNLLILQTCSYGKEKTYYVISAIEIKNYTY